MAFAAPPALHSGPEQPPVQIVDSQFDKSADGSYTYRYAHSDLNLLINRKVEDRKKIDRIWWIHLCRYELSDGYIKEEKGVAVNPGVENSPIDVSGYYRYLDDEGKPIEVHYTANQHGFVPEGAHIQPEITNNARTLVDAKARGIQL